MLLDKSRRWTWPVLLLGLLLVSDPALAAVQADAGSPTKNAFRLHYNKLGHITHSTLTLSNQTSQTIDYPLRYQQPVVQPLRYDNQHSGPIGPLYLPQGRRMHGGLNFIIGNSNQELPIRPDERQTLETIIYPHRIKEKWKILDGLDVIRNFYQSPRWPATVVRYYIKNKTGKKITGFRIKSLISNPDIGGLYRQSEQDDDLIADPRNGILYLRDGSLREEGWLAMAWAPASGMITSNHTYDLDVILETPVIDLENGQKHIAEWLMVWGPSKHEVTRRIGQLRQQSDYTKWARQWEKKQAQGFAITSEDPYIDYVSQVLKGWSCRQVKSNPPSPPMIWPTSTATRAASPQELAAGCRGYLLLGQAEVIKQYIHHWLDERQETPDVVYLVQLIYDYMAHTQNWPWFKENAFRIQELMNYISKLDDDQDGLPNFRVMLPGRDALSTNEPIYNIQDTDLQLLDHCLATIKAYRYMIELFQQADKQEYLQLVAHYRQQYEQAVQVVQENYWDSQLGDKGFYAFARLDDRDLLIHKQHIAAMATFLHDIGEPQRQQLVFQDCWSKAKWLNQMGFYRSFTTGPAEGLDMFQVNAEQYQIHHTHMVLAAGLHMTATAKAAAQAFESYSQKICTSPNFLALPRDVDYQPTAMTFATLSYLEVLTRYYAGLEITPEGIIIHDQKKIVPANLTMTGFSLHGKVITLSITKSRKRKSALKINNKRRLFGNMIDLNKIKSPAVKIEISYGPYSRRALLSRSGR